MRKKKNVDKNTKLYLGSKSGQSSKAGSHSIVNDQEQFPQGLPAWKFIMTGVTSYVR